MEVKKLLLMNNEMWDAIQEWRFANRCESASEAMRLLIALGLSNSLTKSHSRPKHNGKPQEPIVNEFGHVICPPPELA